MSRPWRRLPRPRRRGSRSRSHPCAGCAPAASGPRDQPYHSPRVRPFRRPSLFVRRRCSCASVESSGRVQLSREKRRRWLCANTIAWRSPTSCAIRSRVRAATVSCSLPIDQRHRGGEYFVPGAGERVDSLAAIGRGGAVLDQAARDQVAHHQPGGGRIPARTGAKTRFVPCRAARRGSPASNIGAG